jgi:hypothetical protein
VVHEQDFAGRLTEEDRRLVAQDTLRELRSGEGMASGENWMS